MIQTKQENNAVKAFYIIMFASGTLTFFVVPNPWNIVLGLLLCSLGSLAVMGETMRMRYENLVKKGILKDDDETKKKV